VLNEILGLNNEPKAAVHSVHKVMGPKRKKKKKEYPACDEKKGRLTGLVISCLGTAS